MTALLIFLFCSPSTAQSILPSGYKIPEIKLPLPGPTDHLSFEGLEISGPNRVRFYLQLDRSPANWADDTLRLVIGYPHVWTPNSYYSLLLEGYDNDPDRTVAFIGGMKLRFPSIFHPSSAQTLRSIDRTSVTLKAQDDYLVVADGPERRWYFESPDGGREWRLARLEQIKHPGLFTVLEYEGPLVTAIIYPNGAKARITYQNDLPVRIDTPFGESYRLSYTTGGAIASIECQRQEPIAPGSPRTRETVVARWQFKSDADSRVIEFISPSGKTYVCQHEHSTTREDKTDKQLFLTVITRPADGLFEYRKDEIRGNGEHLLDIGFGGKGQTPDNAVSEYASRLELIQHRWTTTSYTMDGRDNPHTIMTDPAGNAVMEVNPDGKTDTRQFDSLRRPVAQGSAEVMTRYAYNEYGQKTLQADPDGREYRWTYDEHARLVGLVNRDGSATVYEYDQRGFPQRRVTGSIIHEFAFDAMGALTLLNQPGGQHQAWAYDALGRIVKHTSVSTNAGDAKPAIRTCEYRGDLLVKVNHQRGDQVVGAERLILDTAGRVTLFNGLDQQRVNFTYDRNSGWLLSRVQSGELGDFWTYHPTGRVASHRVRGEQSLQEVQFYDPRGNRLSSVPKASTTAAQ